MDDSTADHLTPWSALDPARQMGLRATYAADRACLTGTCSLEAKTRHFAAWLAERGIAFSVDDLHAARRLDRGA